jgi:phosphate:Na+ symporter
VETAAMEVVHMGQIAMENVQLAIDAVISKNVNKAKDVYKTEKTINNMEKMLTEYLVKINNLSLTEEQKIIVNNLFYSINDIERVGDHAENLAEQAEYMAEHEVAFSETGISDLKVICQTAFQSFSHSIDARRRGDMDEVRKVIKYEDEVDALEEELREKHIERLSTGECSTAAGVVFLDLISNLERISDHAYNLAGYVKNEM